MFSLFKNESKKEKTEKRSHNSILTSTKETGNKVSKSVSVIQNKSEYSSLTASHVSTHQIVHKPLPPTFNRTGLRGSVNIDTCLDKITFKGVPARSAFTSKPLTVKSPPSYPSKVSFDAKPFIVSSQTTATNSGNITSQAPPNNSLYSNTGVCPTLQVNELRVKVHIKVEKSTAFCDNPKSIVPVYKTRSKYRGKLLLINNLKFANGKEVRKGAELDYINVAELFKQIGFEVVKYKDLSKKDLMAKIVSFRKDKTLMKVDIGAVIIMSHGTGRERSDSTEIACTDGERLPTTWIINEFDSSICPQLNGKPKIFIFQCCRGDQYDVQHDGIPTTVARKLSDMLIAYATIPGFVAHRDPVNGTWYIQAICKVFMEHAHNTDVESLLKIVDSKLSGLITDHGSKQTSSFENRGFKTCYLHPQLYE